MFKRGDFIALFVSNIMMKFTMTGFIKNEKEL